MFLPVEPWTADEGLASHLERRGVNRRDFLQFCAEMTAILGLSTALTPQIAEALEKSKRPTRDLAPAAGVHRLRRERAPHLRPDDRRPRCST